MGTVRTRTIFRMELCSQEPGMVLELDDFDQPAVRRQPAQHQALSRKLLTVGVVEFKPVSVPFTNFVHAIHLVGKRPFSEAAEIASEAHCPALVAHGLLVVHQVYDWMRRP